MRILAVLLLLLTCCAAFAAPKKGNEKDKEKEQPAKVADYTGPKKRLAVTDMEVKVTTTAATQPTGNGGVVTTVTVDIPPPVDFGTGLTEMLTTALIESKRFILLERKALQDVQGEQALGASGAVDPDSAPKQGKLLGAQVLVRGAVTEYTFRKSSTGGNLAIKGIGLSATNAEAAVVLDIRLIDTTTGQVLDSVKAEGKAKASAAGLSYDGEKYDMSSSTFKQSPLGEATRQAIVKAVDLISQRMEKIPFEARIAELDALEDGTVELIYLNAGTDAGLKVGDVLEIYKPGRDIIDPQTRLVIGRTKDTRLGACKIDTITAALAIAVPMDGTGFTKDLVARLVTPAPQPVENKTDTPKP